MDGKLCVGIVMHPYKLVVISCCLRIYTATENWKIQTLPLARIKKIMKSEEFILQELEKDKQQKAAEEGTETEKPNVKFMISGEAPVLMSKACELLIKDLSFRAWRHTERNRRRTLQRQDLHAAVGESEVYDFLIDIVPRVTTPKASVPNPAEAHSAAAAMAASTMPPMAGMPPTGIPTGAAHPAHAPSAVPPPMPGTMIDAAGNVVHAPPPMQHQAPAPPVHQPGAVHHYPAEQHPAYPGGYAPMAMPQHHQPAPAPVPVGHIDQGVSPVPAPGPPGQQVPQVHPPAPAAAATQWQPPMAHAPAQSG